MTWNLTTFTLERLTHKFRTAWFYCRRISADERKPY